VVGGVLCYKKEKSFVQKSMCNVENNLVSAILGIQPYKKHAIQLLWICA